MDLQKELDIAIKNFELQRDPGLKSGYRIDEHRVYDTYLENTCWDKFKTNIKQMYPMAYEMFNEGSGKELEERKVGRHTFPPKMASFGSSSRMIFNLAKDIPGFQFEEKLPTTVGGVAHLDGFSEKDEEYIFVEAKCREPYVKKDNIIDVKYKELYQFITESDTTSVCCKIEDRPDGKMKVFFQSDDTDIEFFDIKQMISHLLGIGTALLNGRYEEKAVRFLYLMFNPTKIEFEQESVRNLIHDTYKQVYRECNSIDFKQLFHEILVFLQSRKGLGQEKDIEKLLEGFVFTLCDQENYLDKIK